MRVPGHVLVKTSPGRPGGGCTGHIYPGFLGVEASGRDESLSDANFAACEQAALAEISWTVSNKPYKDQLIKAFKGASRLILNEATAPPP